MGTYACNMLVYPYPTYPHQRKIVYLPLRNSIFQTPGTLAAGKLQCQRVSPYVEPREKTEIEVENPRFTWIEIRRDITEAQKEAIAQLPPKMTKRCKALMRQVICFSPHKGNLCDLLAVWVRNMKPQRADWLVVLKELKTMNHPLYLEVLLTF